MLADIEHVLRGDFLFAVSLRVKSSTADDIEPNPTPEYLEWTSYTAYLRDQDMESKRAQMEAYERTQMTAFVEDNQLDPDLSDKEDSADDLLEKRNRRQMRQQRYNDRYYGQQSPRNPYGYQRNYNQHHFSNRNGRLKLK